MANAAAGSAIAVTVPPDWLVVDRAQLTDASRPLSKVLSVQLAAVTGVEGLGVAILEWALRPLAEAGAGLSAVGVIPATDSDEGALAIVVGGLTDQPLPQRAEEWLHEVARALLGDERFGIEVVDSSSRRVLRVDALVARPFVNDPPAERTPEAFVAVYVVDVGELDMWLLCLTPNWQLAQSFLQLFDVIAASARLEPA